MKKGWRTAAACFAVYILSFCIAAAVIRPETNERETVNASVTASRDVSTKTSYIIKEHNGVVAVFLNNENTPVIETDISITGLRQTDRQLLTNGIELENYTDVLYMLEDFNS